MFPIKHKTKRVIVIRDLVLDLEIDNTSDYYTYKEGANYYVIQWALNKDISLYVFNEKGRLTEGLRASEDDLLAAIGWSFEYASPVDRIKAIKEIGYALPRPLATTWLC